MYKAEIKLQSNTKLPRRGFSVNVDWIFFVIQELPFIVFLVLSVYFWWVEIVFDINFSSQIVEEIRERKEIVWVDACILYIMRKLIHAVSIFHLIAGTIGYIVSEMYFNFRSPCKVKANLISCCISSYILNE
jgi:hypothetical protein